MATFAEKVFGAPAGSIVFRSPDIVLTHDNTSSIEKTFLRMGGKNVFDPDRLMVVLDHNAPPTNSNLATNYAEIRRFVEEQGIENFYDAGEGICHQLMADHARPGLLIVGSDSHTCTAGAFNAMAAGIDRTEAAGLWKTGETWFRVPESIQINLTGYLQEGVFAKDLSLWIIGILGSDGANYRSIEYQGDGIETLTVSDRMTLCNLASEMGAKNAVFPADKVLEEYFGENLQNTWADKDAEYSRVINVDMTEVYPLIAAPHHVDNVVALAELSGEPLDQGVIGTCTNGRLEDLREAAAVLEGKKVKKNFQLLVIPASRSIYLQAIEEGLITTFIKAGANVLSSSCGPCLGTGQGIPADGARVISTANRNFLGRMGNKEAEIFLASPAVVAHSAIHGKITDPRPAKGAEKYPFNRPQTPDNEIAGDDFRKVGKVWNYADIDNLNTDLMFAGNLTYKVLSSDPYAILPHLFADFDGSFAPNLEQGDIIIAGENFGCGSSREHPAVGLAHAGVKAVIVKSVNRIFFRAAINQGLALFVHKKAVESYNKGDAVQVDLKNGLLRIADQDFKFAPLPDQLLKILENKGLVNFLKST